MKLVGGITRTMYYNKDKTFINEKLEKYTAPIVGDIMSIDIGRLVFMDDSGQLVLETYRNKKLRETKDYLFEREENKPIINNESSN